MAITIDQESANISYLWGKRRENVLLWNDNGQKRRRWRPVKQEAEVVLNPIHLRPALQVGAIACKECDHLEEAARLRIQLQLLRLLQQLLVLVLVLGFDSIVFSKFFKITSTFVAQGVRKNWFHLRGGAVKAFLMHLNLKDTELNMLSKLLRRENRTSSQNWKLCLFKILPSSSLTDRLKGCSYWQS